jgi:hypothetical protein
VQSKGEEVNEVKQGSVFAGIKSRRESSHIGVGNSYISP